MVYFARIGDDGPIKIGTTVDLPRRLYSHRGADAYGKGFTLLGVMDGGPDAEKEMHAKFARYRLKRREADGQIELFRPAKGLLTWISKNCRNPDLLDGLNENRGQETAGKEYMKTVIEKDLWYKARAVSDDRGMPLADYLCGLIKPILEHEFEEYMRKRCIEIESERLRVEHAIA